MLYIGTWPCSSVNRCFLILNLCFSFFLILLRFYTREKIIVTIKLDKYKDTVKSFLFYVTDI